MTPAVLKDPFHAFVDSVVQRRGGCVVIVSRLIQQHGYNSKEQVLAELRQQWVGLDEFGCGKRSISRSGSQTAPSRPLFAKRK